MTTVTALQAKNRFGKLLQRVSRGEEIIITKHEKPVARLVPEGRPSPSDIRRAVADLRELRASIATRIGSRAKLGFDEIKSAIAEGRR